MAAEREKPRILCLDGGGIRGLSEILILKELMLQIRIHNGLDYTPEPHQCFDFICGTSTGGLVAVLLGRLGKTLDECETLFRTFGSKIFNGGSFRMASRLVLTGSKHTSEGLADVVRRQAGEEKMYQANPLTHGHVPIATDCHSAHLEVESRFKKAGVIDAYFRFDVDRGLESVHLNESDEKALQHISAVTKAYLKEHTDEMERCARLINRRNTSGTSMAIVCSSLPERTATFYGRREELLQIRQGLDPSRPGRKSVLLTGIGGSGKTQLALQHIDQEKNHYSIVVWVNASTREHANRSLAETTAKMATSWPRDLPLFYSGSDTDNLLRVTSRLRTTRHRNWLLVIDSADDPNLDELAKYIPDCAHGSVLVTSTRTRGCRGFRPDNPIHVGGLDTLNSAAARAITTELSGIPLALEQAGALICHGEFTFAQFLAAYKKEYRRLMSTHPDEGVWSYDKNRVIMTILDMAYRSIESNTDHAALLTFIGVLGSWQIPVSFIERFQFFDSGPGESCLISDEISSLKKLLHEPQFLRLALRRLASFSLIRLRKEGGHIGSFIVHRILCQWSLEKVATRHKQDYIMQAAYGLAREISKRDAESSISGEPHALDAGGHMVELSYLAPFKYCFSLISDHISRSDLDPYKGRMRDPYVIILHQAAWAFLAEGLAEKARDCFQNAITLETIRLSQAGVEWPSGMTALTLLDGLSRACHRSGDLNAAIEALESALLLSGRLNGNDSDITLAIVSRLKATSERQETMQQHHKAVVVASTATTQGSSSTKAVHVHEEPQEEASRFRSDNDLLDWELHENENPNTVLFGAAYDGDESMVRLLLGLPNIDPDRRIEMGRTALHMAARGGHKNIVKLLLKTNMVDPNLRDDESRSPLSLAAQAGHSDTVQLLLDGGADIELREKEGLSPLSLAAQAGHSDTTQLLLDKGADIESRERGGASPLSIALLAGHFDIVQLLLDKGADIESKNKLLLDKGADIESKDNATFT
ncbi:hypothetical protein DL770_003120 [Monosporascus sp. CRB-9-2]|nr:hypothetical protein DL770_003120 [Monosporascus sp. CRB-9-2]